MPKLGKRERAMEQEETARIKRDYGPWPCRCFDNGILRYAPVPELFRRLDQRKIRPSDFRDFIKPHLVR